MGLKNLKNAYYMSRLFCIGDSWTHGHGVETDSKYAQIGTGLNHFKNRSLTFERMMNGWPRFLSDHLGGISYINYGICGHTNFHQFEILEKEWDYINNDDIVAIMLTGVMRDNLSTVGQEQVNKMADRIGGYPLSHQLLRYFGDGLRKRGIKFVVCNAFNSPLVYEDPSHVPPLVKGDWDDLKKWKEFYKPKSTMMEELAVMELKINKPLFEYDKFFTDDPHVFPHHPNRNGYKIISDILYNHIKEIY